MTTNTVNQFNSNFARCIDSCIECKKACSTLLAHCSEMGEKNYSSFNLSLLNDCIDICTTSANFLQRDSIYCKEICALATQVCNNCALECEKMSDSDLIMLRCAEACKNCAIECQRMANV